MARRGRPKERYRFRNFDRTYRRYVRDYYRAARRKYNRLHGRKSTARFPSTVSKQDLQDVMYDKLESRADFRTDYKNYKRELLEEESSADPVQYIVSNQTYEFSYKQYRGFKRAVKEAKFKEITGLDLEGVNEISFRSGEWRDDKFYEAARKYYHEMKAEAESLGKQGKNIWQYASEEVSKLFFYGDS